MSEMLHAWLSAASILKLVIIGEIQLQIKAIRREMVHCLSYYDCVELCCSSSKDNEFAVKCMPEHPRAWIPEQPKKESSLLSKGLRCGNLGSNPQTHYCLKSHFFHIVKFRCDVMLKDWIWKTQVQIPTVPRSLLVDFELVTCLA